MHFTHIIVQFNSTQNENKLLRDIKKIVLNYFSKKLEGNVLFSGRVFWVLFRGSCDERFIEHNT